MARNWTPEERQKQAQAIQKRKPWKNSTGPKTPEGKAAVRDNAYKHGYRSRDIRRFQELLREYNRRLNEILDSHCAHEPLPEMPPFPLPPGVEEKEAPASPDAPLAPPRHEDDNSKITAKPRQTAENMVE